MERRAWKAKLEEEKRKRRLEAERRERERLKRLEQDRIDLLLKDAVAFQREPIGSTAIRAKPEQNPKNRNYRQLNIWER